MAFVSVKQRLLHAHTYSLTHVLHTRVRSSARAPYTAKKLKKKKNTRDLCRVTATLAVDGGQSQFPVCGQNQIGHFLEIPPSIQPILAGHSLPMRHRPATQCCARGAIWPIYTRHSMPSAYWGHIRFCFSAFWLVVETEPSTAIYFTDANS